MQTKYKQSKTEASSAQNTLQKEITTLRDANRTLTLKLRDIEVSNDDFEIQARNTFSSLENLESKYNVSIERTVMLEEEIKSGEQEREGLRIEMQRLREEHGDLKIEAEILQDKLRKRQLPSISTGLMPDAAVYDGSPRSTASSPMITTPPGTKSISTADTSSEAATPPSPPMSDASANARPVATTPINPLKTRRLPSVASATPKAATSSRIPSATLRRGPPSTHANTRNRNATPHVIRNTRAKAPSTRGMPNSTSLTHIRTLTAQMQRLELRVQNAKSKLPAPINTPPRASPRGASAMGNYMPPSVTVRSRKRTIGSAASASTRSSIGGEEDTPTTRHVSRISTSGISRLSFGPVARRESQGARPGSRARVEREGEDSRPSSRASGSSFAASGSSFAASGSSVAASGSGSRFPRPLSRGDAPRPISRTATVRTPLGHYSQSVMARSRSSIGGSYAATHGGGAGHGYSQSVSHIDRDDVDFLTPSRRGTFSMEGSALPLPRRSITGSISVPARRSSNAVPEAEEGLNPPVRPRKLSHVGESY